MAINLKATKGDVKSALADPLQLHYIPASINGDGPANVEKFFTPYTENQTGGVLQNALRGYPLLGKEMTLPEGYTGVIFQETKKPLSSDDDRNFTFGGAFRTLTYWNYDRNPTQNDPFSKALNWLKLSEALHGEEEDIDAPKPEPASSKTNKVKQEKGTAS
ncbi:ribonuclease H2 subunit C [Anopheles aquasalis]|uniref:ribonuclease H2 subunit C n=1 Tax=Anopheles aquasalis TaxID=42839 RepID=UPI00215A3F40|nr:ribonuclease H2 subunit C [Anopheles aquasalis]